MPVSHAVGEFALRPSRFKYPLPMGEQEAARTVMPFQDLGELLVRHLARVGWDVPGLEVKLRTYGQGTNLITCVDSVSGKIGYGPLFVPFELEFNGSQGLVSGYHITTGLNEAILPSGFKIALHSDGSRSAEKWMGTGDVDDPTFRARYSDGWKRLENVGSRFWSSRIAEARTLVEAVVRDLMQMKDAPGCEVVDENGFDANLKRLLHVHPVPAPADFPTLYVWNKPNDMGRTLGVGHQVAERPEDDYVLAGNGWRLVAIGDARQPLPERATDGFTYAATDPNTKAVAPGWTPNEEALPVEVKLLALNEIYVVDAAAYAAERNVVCAEADAAGRDKLIRAEMVRPYNAVGRTMVPAADYKGGYAQPLYLIGRQLHGDEARVMSGPIKVLAADGMISATMRDVVSGNDLQLLAPEEIYRGTVMAAQRIAQRAGEFLHVRVREIDLPTYDEPKLLSA